jgi:uncharacterized membrane protein
VSNLTNPNEKYLSYVSRGVAAAIAISNWLNPITTGPSGPLAAGAALDAFGPSLMPRKSAHQGGAAGLAILAARAVGTSVDTLARTSAPESSPLAWKLAARGMLAAFGSAVARISEEPDESTPRATVRTAGRLTAVAAVGGMIHEVGKDLSSKTSAPLVPIVTGIGGFAYVASRFARELETRNALIQRWTDDDKPADLAPSIAIAAALGLTGRAAAAGFRTSQSSLVSFMGDTPAHRMIGYGVNLAMWGSGMASLYLTLVSRLAKLNGNIEERFSEPPTSEFVSGGPGSISPFKELGLQGRRYVSEVVTPEVIESTLGEPVVTHPIRAYVGFDSEPFYATRRSEMALEELERLGAFDRKYLLLVSPTGTGWVDHTMIESAEILSRGDIATICIQYGRAPSFVELQSVALGRSQFRQLLWGIRQRLIGIKEEDRPRILVFGESLGAWSSSDVVMHQGIEGFDHYGIHRALWFGLPGLAKWSKTGMGEGRNPLTPAGTVRAFDRFEQFEALDEAEKEKLRAIVVDHDNDPIARISLRLAVKRPEWLIGEHGRGVAAQMKWTPLITFTQVLVDAANGMVVVPGEFKSFGHDYRADTAEFVHAAYEFPDVTPEQMQAINETLAGRELDRARRIKGDGDVADSSMEVVGGIQ